MRKLSLLKQLYLIIFVSHHYEGVKITLIVFFLDENMAHVFLINIPHNQFLLSVVKYRYLILLFDFFDLRCNWVRKYSKKWTSVVHLTIFCIHIVHQFVFTVATIQLFKFLLHNETDRNIFGIRFLNFYCEKWSRWTRNGLLSIQNNVLFTLIRLFNDDRRVRIFPCVVSFESRSEIVWINFEGDVITILHENAVTFDFLRQLIDSQLFNLLFYLFWLRFI